MTTNMIIVATIIIFKQFLKKVILSIVEPQVFVLLLLSSPNFAQDANNGETLIYFSTNWFADFFCDWEKDPLFFALSSPFLANSLFFLRKERVRGSLEICRVPQNGRHWTSQHYLAGLWRNIRERSKLCRIDKDILGNSLRCKAETKWRRFGRDPWGHHETGDHNDDWL